MSVAITANEHSRSFTEKHEATQNDCRVCDIHLLTQEDDIEMLLRVAAARVRGLNKAKIR